MTSYRNRLDRRDIVMATITAIIGACTTVLAVIGIFLLSAQRL
jgi:hypothetical protein